MLLVTVSISTSDFVISSTPPHRCIYHWSRTKWDRLSHHFSSVTWDLSGCVESAVSCTTAVIVSATRKFVPSCVPKVIRPTPLWNRYCEGAWKRKLFYWSNHDIDGFCRATSIAARVYARAFRDYKSSVIDKLRGSPTDRYWWTLTKSLSGIASRERYAVPSPSSLAAYFAAKLSTHANDTTSEPHLEHPSDVLLHQFRVKKSRVRYVLTHLDPAKSMGDDNISPRVLRYCASSLCGPLTALFRKICRSSIFHLLGRSAVSHPFTSVAHVLILQIIVLWLCFPPYLVFLNEFCCLGCRNILHLLFLLNSSVLCQAVAVLMLVFL